jgi:hypothetical protein
LVAKQTIENDEEPSRLLTLFVEDLVREEGDDVACL